MTTELEEKIVVEVDAEAELAKETMERLKQYLFDYGKIFLIGNSGTGKTNACMHFVRYLMNTQEYKDGNLYVRICDSAGVWREKFDKIPFVDITKKATVPIEERTVLLDLGFLSVEKNVAVVENLIKQDYYIQRELMTKRLQMPIRVYIAEEAQNLFGSYRRGGIWLKFFSECRNFNQFMIGLTQRLSDVNTQFCERTKYFMIGSLSGANDLRKVKSMFEKDVGGRLIHEIQALRRGEFILVDTYNTENSLKIYFPKFEQSGVPFEWNIGNNGHIRVERVFL